MGSNVGSNVGSISSSSLVVIVVMVAMVVMVVTPKKAVRKLQDLKPTVPYFVKLAKHISVHRLSIC
jgi:hypothetical protein